MPDKTPPPELLKKAREARKNAYAPYSKYKVGAAVLCKDGTIYGGCNMENASYGLTMCAERNALAQAVAAGHKKFTAIAIVVDDREPASPCGACRQVIREFGPDIDVFLYTVRGKKMETTIEELLPQAFADFVPGGPKGKGGAGKKRSKSKKRSTKGKNK